MRVLLYSIHSVSVWTAEQVSYRDASDTAESGSCTAADADFRPALRTCTGCSALAAAGWKVGVGSCANAIGRGRFPSIVRTESGRTQLRVEAVVAGTEFSRTALDPSFIAVLFILLTYY